ncbi:hypothetical protein [uncultured Nostoc sp.]|uniref:hypothetical protein n=1 Tax=uncultured Nostoc sp. TaxID=340711 RepID=UPI0035CA82D2
MAFASVPLPLPYRRCFCRASLESLHLIATPPRSLPASSSTKIIFDPNKSFFRFKCSAKMAEMKITQNNHSKYGYFIF